jgi:hypothetical protein
MAISAQLRREVIERAGNCCEYCRMARDDRLIPFHIDHIMAIKHGGTDEADNLCFACYKCNGFKSSNIASIDPETGQPVLLFHPRQQQWDEHFGLDDSAEIVPLTPEGRVTVFLLRMNDNSRIHQRRMLIELGRYPCTKEML